MSICHDDRSDRNKEKINAVPKIINFSSHDLNKAEISLLSKGFKFCPTPVKPDLLQLEVDINETIRKIELKCHFSNNNKNLETQYKEPLVQNNSNYIPPESKDPILNSIIKNTKIFSKNLHSLPKNKVRDNISKIERDAIESLKNNKDIILTSVDKGSSIVILNRADYVNSINSQLSDCTKYCQEDKNPNNKYLKLLKDFTDEFSSCFDERGKEVDFILNFETKLANFYGLPKLHKCTSIFKLLEECNKSYIKTAFPTDLPFRCITAGINSPFSKLSILLDKILKPICTKVQSYIRDYVDFLDKKPKGEQNNQEDIEFVTCDIKNMYNNLPVSLIIEAIKFWLNDSLTLINPRFSSDFIITGLKLVLSHSSFKFNGVFYSLLEGVPTGEPVAATVATLTIGFLELKLYEEVRKAIGNRVEDYFRKNWKRFLDDCFIVWRKSFGDFNIIFNIINNLHPSLTFTKEQNETGLSFLNLFIYKENGFIKSDIFYKPTDSHDYLPFNSCHPRHIKSNVPSNLARMICSIVEDPVRREKRLGDLKSWLLKCGYPKMLIKFCFSKYENENCESLRTQIDRSNSDDVLACVITFNPKNPHIFSELYNNVKFLKSNPLYSKVFHNCKLIKSQRQLPNLGRILENHDIALEQKPKGCFRCTAKKCDTCNFIEVTSSISFNREIYNLNRHFDCNTKNVIYKLTCNYCNEFYIGKTNDFKNRVSKHKSDTKLAEQRLLENRYVMKVSQHLFYCKPGCNFSFKIVPFYEVRNPTLIALLTIEDYFVRKYKPSLNG